MKVEPFEEKFTSLQKEASELMDLLKPLMPRLKKLGKQAYALGCKADCDRNLYKEENGDTVSDGWDTQILFRLWDFMCFDDCWKSLDAVLYNLKKSKFRKKSKSRKIQFRNEP